MNSIKLSLVLIAMFAIVIPCVARKNLRLSGMWEFREKSLDQKQPVFVTLDQEELFLRFLRDLGTVSVILTDASGETVSTTIVETQKMPCLSIQVPSIGCFTLRITDGKNNIYSDFCL